MESFERVYARTARRHGGEAALEERLPRAKTSRQLNAVGDDRYLAEMAKCIFRAGFVWKVVAAKWPGFEEVFFDFDAERLAALSDRNIGGMSADSRIIRNAKKVQAVCDTAAFVLDTSRRHGGFGRFLTAWPADDTVGLWLHLRQEGQRLGGNTGPMFLRGCGKDTFLLTRDVVGYLVDQGVVKKKPSGKGDLRKVQEAFNRWAKESGRPLCQISRVISLSWEGTYS